MQWTPIENLRKALNNSTAQHDRELEQYAYRAQALIERLTGREFDANISKTEIKDGGHDFVSLLRYPIRSITSLKIDSSRDFDNASAESDSTYFTTDDGALHLRSARFPEKDACVQVIYKGGYYGLKTVVEAAAPSASHTIANSLALVASEYTLFLVTSGTTGAGSATIVGEDENGDAVTEVVTPYATDLTAGNMTISAVPGLFTEVTSVNSASITGGTVKLLASDIPADLIQALQMLTVHFFEADEEGKQGVAQYSTAGASESGFVNDLPSEAMRIIESRRRYAA